MTKSPQDASNHHESILVDDSQLRSLRTRPALPVYLKRLWNCRHFIRADARSKALHTGRGTFLGKAWIILDPLLQVMVYAVVFGLVLQTTRGVNNFVGFLIIGVIFFRFLTGGLSGGSGLIQSSRAMLSSFNFPRATLVLAVNLRQLIDNFFPAIIAVVLALLTQIGQPPHWPILLVIPLYFLVHLFALGLTLIVARITAFIPDTKSLVALLQRALFFISGIFFSVERFDSHPLLQKIMTANPFYQFLSAIRTCVLDGQVPSLNTWLYLFAWTFSLLIIGIVFFWQAESRYSSVK